MLFDILGTLVQSLLSMKKRFLATGSDVSVDEEGTLAVFFSNLLKNM